MRLRITAAGAVVASIVTFALAVVLLAAGSSPSMANDDYWVALNTSNVGANLVTVGPSSSDTSSSDPLGSIISSIPGLDSILNNLTQQIGDGLSDVQGEVVGALVSGLGLKDFYILYATKMCEGNTNSNRGINVDKCYSYHDEGQGLMNISNSIPSSFTIANTQVAVPLVSSLQGTLKSIVNLAEGVSTAMMVLLIITSVASGMTAIVSVLGILWTKSRLVIVINLGFSAIAATAISSLAIALTGVVLSIVNMVNSFGSGLSLNVKSGAPFLAIIWVATVFAFVANSYWFIVWFVEFRRTAFSRRSRTNHQIGNWRGILGEVKKDFKTDGHFSPSEGYGEQGKRKSVREKQPAEQELGRALSLT